MNFLSLRAQQVLALARKEADRFNHKYVGTEHLLFALIKLDQGGAANMLQKLQVDLPTVRVELEKQIGSGAETRISGSIPYTPRVKKVLALAGKEAKALGRDYVGTEHILLGLLREGDGIAARILLTTGVEIERARTLAAEEVSVAAQGVSPLSSVYEVRRTSQLDDMSKKLDALMDLVGRLALEVTELRLSRPKGNA